MRGRHVTRAVLPATGIFFRLQRKFVRDDLGRLRLTRSNNSRLTECADRFGLYVMLEIVRGAFACADEGVTPRAIWRLDRTGPQRPGHD